MNLLVPSDDNDTDVGRNRPTYLLILWNSHPWPIFKVIVFKVWNLGVYIADYYADYYDDNEKIFVSIKTNR